MPSSNLTSLESAATPQYWHVGSRPSRRLGLIVLQDEPTISTVDDGIGANETFINLRHHLR